uniref:Uncharacterized protein n=1 Tax=Escherichia phage fEgEco12 TaxID=3158837 RepID=A0AAU7PJ13_9CAUD
MTLLLILGLLVSYFIFLNIFSDASHFAYASAIAKHEGIKKYIPALLFSYMYHPRYFTLGVFDKYVYDEKALNEIEYFVRTHANNNTKSLINFTDNRKRVSIRSDLYPTSHFHLGDCSVYRVRYENLLLPPSHIRYIEKYLLKCVDSK